MCRHLAVFFCTAALAVSVEAGIQFPGPEWEHRTPAETGVDGASLDTLAGRLGGRGCVIKDGYVIKDWGDQTRIGDWASAAKPVLSTLLFFAIEEGLVTSVDQPVADFGWALQPRHRGITFRQLGAMTSGYARPEGAGEAWAYNDFAIQLYQKTLFEKIFKQQSKEAAEQRLAALGLQDGLRFTERNRLSASVRDYARIVWFWTQKGQWDGRQVLPRRYFNEYMRPQTPKDIPLSQETGEDDDYLAIGSYGGGSNHFSNAGPGIYGSNWWFNDTGRFHPEEMTWPDAPPDTVMAMGVRGNCAAFIPSLNAALICADGKWGDIEGGNRDARLNQILGLFARANGYTPLDSSAPSHAKWSRVVLDFEGPAANAADSDPNPFLDYRMQVRFTGPGGSEYDVPGFFDGDGAGGIHHVLLAHRVA
ncbi:MAG TPA: DUF5060 domain-containing protein, partial [Candidatus Hydrogenedentes bacterium]|nr:DUF5060 domain-containing protein [Candidatus Hydrogenedentota bacterium]